MLWWTLFIIQVHLCSGEEEEGLEDEEEEEFDEEEVGLATVYKENLDVINSFILKYRFYKNQIKLL